MVLSNSYQSLQVVEPTFSPPNRKARYKSYAQAVTAANRVSLLYNHIEHPHIDDDSTLDTLQAKSIQIV
ncbi:hypothetical protein G6F43_008361 [Rhizopus delemar]|nr:hypothetical protein G6F43_008361 [Rhizopus delemar]